MVKTGDTVTIDSTCTVAGRTVSTHAVVTGSFDSAYTMTVTAEGSALPPVKMTIEGKWLSACAAGQQPGDVIMAKNGAFFSMAAKVDPRWHTPVIAILCQGVCGMPSASAGRS